jgi:glycogen synthase
MEKGKLKQTGRHFTVPYHNKNIKARLYEYTWNYRKPKKGSLKEYYIRAEGFFDAKNSMNDPYVYNENDSQLNHDLMNENALFFCRAVPLAMKALGIRENIIFHLQEWQTALLSLTSKEAMLNSTLESCGTVQTMHNSYDSLISWRLLTRGVDRPRKKLIAQFPADGMTAYQIGLQLVDAPVTTVSTHFANEFTTDILHTRHFAPHLQNIFRKTGVYGVNNGMFTDLSDEFPKQENHTVDEIQKIKLKNRKVLLKIIYPF